MEKGKGFLERRVEAILDCFQQDGPDCTILYQVLVIDKQFPSVNSVTRRRLLQQDMLASCERSHSPFVVQAIWQRDVDGIDIGGRRAELCMNGG